MSDVKQQEYVGSPYADMAQRSVEVLKEELGRRPQKMENGTVVRWGHNGYTYVALIADGRAFIAGNAKYYGSAVQSHEDFIDILADADYVSIAATWEQVR